MILSGRKIKKSFQSDGFTAPVLRGIDIEIEAGEFVSIMGKSGSGKSTLLNILSTLDNCDEGEVFFRERNITELGHEDAAKLRLETFGFVFQLPRMVKNLNIINNILLPSLKYKENKREAADEAKQLMEEVGIAELADKRVTQVSGGQLQRAGICRALINRPDLIFADEPTGALDSKTGRDVLKLFSKFHRDGRTVLLVTHDVNVTAESERVLFLKDGMIYGEVKPDADKKIEPSELRSLIDEM